MNNNSLLAALDALRRAQSILVTSHVHPDGDAIGSMIAMRHLLRGLGKEAIHMVNEDGVPLQYRWMAGADDIAQPSADIPAFDTAVIVDTGRLERIGAVADHIKSEHAIVVVDHHIEETPCGHYNVSDCSYAATGELMWDMFAEAGVDPAPAAESIYVALITDTGGFRFNNTTPRSHRTAAALLECGIDAAGIAEQVFDGMSPSKFHLLRRCLSQAAFCANGRIAHTAASRADLRESGALNEDTEGIINHLRSVEGVQVAILFREIDANTTKVSFRSRDGFNSAAFLGQFGGGGHALAAGATVALPLDEARQTVLERLEDEIGEGRERHSACR